MIELTEVPERTRTVTWTDPLEAVAGATGVSGIDHLRAIAAGEVPPPPIALLLGMGIAEVEVGRAVFTLDVGEHLYNPIGSVHGGIFATVLDSAMGCAVHSTLAAGQAYTTTDLNVHLVRALTTDVPGVHCEGTWVSGGRRVATATGRIYDESGRLYAHGSTTCAILAPS